MSRGDQHTTGEKGRRRESAIMDAAGQLFAEQGYERTTTQDIADATGILKGSLYYYIGSKEQLLFRVLLSTQEQLHAFVVEEVDTPPPGPLEAVEIFIRRHVEWVLEHSSVAALYGQEHHVVRSVDAWWQALVEARHIHEQSLLELLRAVDAHAATTTEEDLMLTTRALLSMANGTRRWFHRDGTLAAHDVAAHHARLAVRSLHRPD
ncbi:TetR/AcrR family transcriptional regulator [Aeromicrobium sp.]|uniref:TetR/AcrR family transcriptional regulator n=1 Tax=Aeromicrobium sp. TaxID=1871063 RepID=UPI0019CD70FE|nr:TetR/AcrR family transcriptional regulator [Aeromicrobium sp.]MBC7632512.1 TetR/AcrR family transcriptional regulator [Aeromicrobium sp.]